MFTESEGGEQHCQIGNHLIAINYIIDWLDKYFKAGMPIYGKETAEKEL